MTSWTEILKANKGLHARDSFSELWGLKLKAAREEFPDYTITGTLPLTFNSRVAGALKNYRLYGTASGSGEYSDIQLNEPLYGIGDYKDTLNLFTGLLTKKVKNLVLTGEETVFITSRKEGENLIQFVSPIPYISTGVSNDMLCTHFEIANTAAATSVVQEMALRSNGTDLIYGLEYSLINGETSDTNVVLCNKVKAYFADQYAAGTPITVWYALAESMTETIAIPAGLTGTIEGYLTQSGTPTPANPIYPTANGTILPNDKYEVFNSYKIPILNTSGVTENLFDKDAKDVNNGYVDKRYLLANGTFSDYGASWIVSEYIPINSNTYYTLGKMERGSWGTYNAFYDANKELISTFQNVNGTFQTVASPANAAFIRLSVRTAESEIEVYMLVKGSTAPDHYIPHRYTSNYDLFLGDSQLGEEEYVDFSEQKVYKDISGTLTPTDPPVPLPAIQAYQGENTLSSTETVGEVSITGKITEMA